MIENIKHITGLCGEAHISLLLIFFIYILVYYRHNKIKKHDKKF
jgi:hypothetical protein